MTNDEKEDFLAACAAILGTEHHFVDGRPAPRVSWSTGTLWQPPTKGGRWSGRTPGNGRLSGYGTIRVFRRDCIAVALRHPVSVQRQFSSPQEVLAFLHQAAASG